jgi:hypothetical protein
MDERRESNDAGEFLAFVVAVSVLIVMGLLAVGMYLAIRWVGANPPGWW